MPPPLRNATHALVLVLALLSACGHSAEHGGTPTCTAPGGRDPRVPACKASWDEVRTSTPTYSITRDHAYTRGYDRWCAGAAECRCSPPPGKEIVKKRLYKSDGTERRDKVPKYEVEMKAAEPCDCARCRGVCFWNPLSVLLYLLHH